MTRTADDKQAVRMTSSLDSCSSPQKRRTIFRSHRETQIDAIYSASRISGRPITEARDPGQIRPGALVVAGDEDTAVVCQVIDLVPAGDAIVVHLKQLPGLVEDYQALAERSLAS